VPWRSIDLMEVVPDHGLTKAYGAVRYRTIKRSLYRRKTI
jgi:hypothetical protein